MENFFGFFEQITYFDVIVILSITIPIYLTAKFTRLRKDNYKLTLKDKIVYCASILLFFLLFMINAFSKIQ
jgi:hypothetical protein